MRIKTAELHNCTTCTLCKKFYIGETRRLGDRFREHLRDVEKDENNASKPIARHFNLPYHQACLTLNSRVVTNGHCSLSVSQERSSYHSKEHMAVCDFSLHQGSTESRKTLEQKFIFQIGSLNPHGINERFSFN